MVREVVLHFHDPPLQSYHFYNLSSFLNKTGLLIGRILLLCT